MKRYYVEFITNTMDRGHMEGLPPQISFYVYGWSADQVRDQLRDYEIISCDQTD
jgi:hypothetical protein